LDLITFGIGYCAADAKAQLRRLLDQSPANVELFELRTVPRPAKAGALCAAIATTRAMAVDNVVRSCWSLVGTRTANQE
jgi:hypothetical protein